MFICSTLHILLRFYSFDFFSALLCFCFCFGPCLLLWDDDGICKFTHKMQCILWNEATRCERESEKTNWERVWLQASCKQCTLFAFVCACVSFGPSICTSAHTLCLHHQHCWTKPTTNKRPSENLDDEQKMGTVLKEKEIETRMTLLATVLLTLYLCVNSVFFFSRRNSLCMCTVHTEWCTAFYRFSFRCIFVMVHTRDNSNITRLHWHKYNYYYTAIVSTDNRCICICIRIRISISICICIWFIHKKLRLRLCNELPMVILHFFRFH